MLEDRISYQTSQFGNPPTDPKSGLPDLSTYVPVYSHSTASIAINTLPTHSEPALTTGLNDLEASSGLNFSPDVLIPHYSDNIPFMALDVDSMEDNETSDPSYHGYIQCVPGYAKVVNIL